MKTQEIEFQNYKIRFTDNKSIAFHKHYTNRLKKFEGSNPITMAKEWIRNYIESNNIWKENKLVNASFNTKFIDDIMGGEELFSCDLDENLVLSINLNEDKLNHKACPKFAGKRKGTQINLNSNLLKSLNIVSNSRYTLEEIEVNKFQLVFDSVILDKGDKYRLSEPGVMFYCERK